MAKVNVLVLTGYGTNSHAESAHAALLAGADRADIVHFSDIVEGEARLEYYHMLVFPGGFLDGDDLGAAQAAAQRWLHLADKAGVPLLDHLSRFLDDGKLMLGICNGFQLMVKLGLLPALDGKRFERQVSLTHNASARYEDRWVRLAVNPLSPCVFTRGLNHLMMPVRHGEGRLVVPDDATLDRLEAGNLVTLSYADPQSGRPTRAKGIRSARRRILRTCPQRVPRAEAWESPRRPCRPPRRRRNSRREGLRAARTARPSFYSVF
mgnify:CR=1 FL=1